MRNIAVRIAYDGAGYHGWQIQKNNVTVQGAVRGAISEIVKHPVSVVGCGRTDAGVHAERYCINFKSDTAIPCSRLPLAMNALLPGDISAYDAVDVEDDFNAILSCKGKEYTYRILNSPVRDPFLEKRAWFYPQKLDIDVLSRAVSHFVGTHDFAAVRSVGTETKSTVRTISYFDVFKSGDIVSFRVFADGFLYNMVRAMVGTAVYASMGKLDADAIPEILASRNRTLAGPTAPPQGLYMTRVDYDGPAGEMMRR